MTKIQMTCSTTVSSIFNCSLERAFKTPILGNATKFLNGYLLQPAVSGFEDDKTWGQVSGIRYPVTNGNLLVKKGRLFKDEILQRKENEYWQWTIYDFEISALFFASKAVGEWRIKEKGSNQVSVQYTYTYVSKNMLLHPITYLFVKIQIHGMMRKAIRKIKQQAESEAPYIYQV